MNDSFFLEIVEKNVLLRRYINRVLVCEKVWMK